MQTGPQVELIAAKLDSQLPTEHVAADGFPIDSVLQKRARRAAIGYGLLALYYVAVMPFVLRFMRWGSLGAIAEDVFARFEVLAMLLGYFAGNVFLAACAWHVIAMRRWASWTVAGVSLAFTLWACGNIGSGLVRIAIAPDVSFASLRTAVSLGLVVGYTSCCAVLWRAVIAFNAARAKRLAEIEGRVGA